MADQYIDIRDYHNTAKNSDIHGLVVDILKLRFSQRILCKLFLDTKQGFVAML
jgi:hypothetical protein